MAEPGLGARFPALGPWVLCYPLLCHLTLLSHEVICPIVLALAKKMIRLTHTKKNALEGTEVSDKAPGSLYDVFSM